jgi:hypothetical protein
MDRRSDSLIEGCWGVGAVRRPWRWLEVATGCWSPPVIRAIDADAKTVRVAGASGKVLKGRMFVAPAVASKRDYYLGMWREALDLCLEVTPLCRYLMARAYWSGITKAGGTVG